jgi:PAS domain S-box-containing protein
MPQISKRKLAIDIIMVLVFTITVTAGIHYAVRSYMLDRAEQSVENLILSQRGLHHYIQKVMHPAFYKAIEKGGISRDFYTPELFSSSYIVRVMHGFYNEELLKHNRPNIYYKLASENPRNPINKADPFEIDLIKMFNANRDMKEFHQIITIDGEKYFYYAKPFLENDKPCLRCHGKPEDAPVGLQALYPGEGGFNEKTGHIRAIESIRAPMQRDLTILITVYAFVSITALSLITLFLIGKRLRTEVRVKTNNLENELAARKQAEIDIQLQTKELEKEITERKASQEALKESEQYFRSLVEFAPEALFVQSHNRFVYLNPLMLNLLGANSQEELIGRDFRDFVAPEYLNAVKDRISFQFSTGMPAPPMEQEYLTLHGQRIPVETTAMAIRYHGENANLVFVRDIRYRKHSEEEKAKLQAQLLHAQKLESVGRLAGGIAHDFNNILMIIKNCCYICMKETDSNHQTYQFLIETNKAAQRATDLTRQLLAFSRQQHIAAKVIDLSEVVGGMTKMIKRLIGEDIHLECASAKDIWAVRLDPSQIDQILVNLCVNSRDAIRDVGKINIEITNQKIDESYCEEHPYFKPGEYVLLTVSDNGSGMNADILSHIFEPFYTTKEMGKGTGLGLAMVYGIVKQNDGFIEVCSEPDIGTTFKIFFPRYKGEDTTNNGEKDEIIIPRGHETILLAEDDAEILSLCSQMLTALGYKVLSANTPAEAINLAREHREEINLLLTDVIMPDMNGKDLAERLRETHPELKCLFMSGYTADIISQHVEIEDGIFFMQKPFSLSDIGSKVRELLDG